MLDAQLTKDAARWRCVESFLCAEPGILLDDGTRNHWLGIRANLKVNLAATSPAPTVATLIDKVIDAARLAEQLLDPGLAVEEASCEGGQVDGVGGSDE
jgi:hypothetical protein